MNIQQGNDLPLISVIIPYYNAEENLNRCLDSMTRQSYQNLEILMVNDGSEDGSGAIVESYAKKDPRVVSVIIPHSGVSVARNSGLERASGDYILFVDGDDWMGETAVEHMMEVMLESGVDMTTCQITRAVHLDETRAPQPLQYTICTQEDYMLLLFKIKSNEWVHFPVAKLYKKELLPNPLYPPGIRVGEDVLGTYLAVKGTQKIARLAEVGYYYFFNPHGATSCFGQADFDLLPLWDQVVEAARGTEPDYSYAVLNRKRINFTVLFRMVTEVPRKERIEKFADQEKQLRRALKQCEKDLLTAPIVFSRKVILFFLCHCYPLVSFFGNLYVRIGQMRGSEIAAVQRRPLS